MPETPAGATVPPLYLTSTYTYSDLDHPPPTDYGRHGNPTRAALERCLAGLEDAQHCVAFASGMAAIDAVLRLAEPGDTVLAMEGIYGGSSKLLDTIHRRAGLHIRAFDGMDPRAFERALECGPKLVLAETPTNPLLRVADIEALARLSNAAGALLLVDSTFATPLGLQPLSLGADLVVHSATKYLGGHTDLVGGAVLTNRDDLHERLALVSRVAGAIPGPFDCWLALRGIKTLAVRMREHERNALAVASFLETHFAVKRVLYPGLASHPQHMLARRVLRCFGGMLAFEVDGGEAAKRILNRLRLFTLTGTLGGVESIASYPWKMSHVALPEAEREQLGITAGLIRLSVGIEEAADLIEDLRQALGGEA